MKNFRRKITLGSLCVLFALPFVSLFDFTPRAVQSQEEEKVYAGEETLVSPFTVATQAAIKDSYKAEWLPVSEGDYQVQALPNAPANSGRVIEETPQPTVVPTAALVKKIKKAKKKRQFIQMNTQNVLEKSNVTAKQLKAVLRPNLKEFADEFVQAEKETGVNAFFLSSIATLESGGNTHQKYPNNIMGWEGTRQFTSEEDCIDYVSKRLKWWFLTKPHKTTAKCDRDHPGQKNPYGYCLIGVNYNGLSVAAVNKKYNGREHWEEEVEEIMREYYTGVEGRRKD